MLFKDKTNFSNKIKKSEISFSKFIPYKCHWNSDTILTKNDELIRIVKIKGLSFETADDIDIDFRKIARNNLLKTMSVGNFSLYFHTIRKKEKAFPDGDMPCILTRELNKQWKEKHSDDKSFVNEHYLTIIRGKNSSAIALLESIVNALKHKTDKLSWENHIREAFAELEEVTIRILNAFSYYSAKLLSIKYDNNNRPYSEISEFLSKLINGNYSHKFPLNSHSLDQNLNNSRLYFYNKYIEIHRPNTVKYAGIISLKEYRPSTYAGILDGFLQLPFELIISQSFSFIDKQIAVGAMQLQQRRLIQSEDVAVSQIQEINQALDSAVSGEFSFGNHHLTILCIEDNIKSLENILSMAIVTLSNVGIIGIREMFNLQPAYFGQLPGNISCIARKSVINSLNMSSFASFHNYPSGKRSGNHWGNAVTVFNTISGTPFFFSFHVRDVGHTMIIGPTGSGKTVLLNFLSAQAMKFKPKLFFFDKDRGAEIFIRSINGKYITPTISKISGFNPFQLEDNPENRSFLIEFLTILLTVNEKKVTAEDMEKVENAVNGNFKLPKKQRKLSNIAPFLGLNSPGSIASRLLMWHSGGSHSKLFDNNNDLIDFSKDNIFGINMTSILQDKYSLEPVLLYLFHRINQSLDGSPTMIVLDEAWALIDNDIFAPKIKDWLKVLRKLNTFVVFATQSVEDASNSSISDTLVQQTATQIFLPNLKATEAYKKVFMLTDNEFSIVKSTDPASRFFLLKQDNDALVARIDLSGMEDMVNILSGNAKTVELLHKIIKKTGIKAEKWLDVFCKLARDL